MVVDFTERAIKRTYQKGRRENSDIKISKVDAQQLQNLAESFGKVLCFRVIDHVIDFTKVDTQAIREILRVFKRENIALRLGRVEDIICHSSNPGEYLIILRDLLVQLALDILYVPIFLRAKKSVYSYNGLEAML